MLGKGISLELQSSQKMRPQSRQWCYIHSRRQYWKIDRQSEKESYLVLVESPSEDENWKHLTFRRKIPNSAWHLLHFCTASSGCQVFPRDSRFCTSLTLAASSIITILLPIFFLSCVWKERTNKQLERIMESKNSSAESGVWKILNTQLNSSRCIVRPSSLRGRKSESDGSHVFSCAEVRSWVLC